MYIDNENFEKWMEKLSKKLTEIGQDLKSLINTDTVFDENERLLDNQDLAFLLKASFRTLQRYRAKGVLPYFTMDEKRIIKPAIFELSSVSMPILKPTNSLKKPISWLISSDSKK